MLALVEVLPERLTKHRGVRDAGQITGDHGKDPGQRLQDGTRLLAATLFQAKAAYSRACSRSDTSVRVRSSDSGNPVSVSNASPLVAAVMSCARKESASALIVND